MPEKLRISEIRMDGETQPRSQIDTVTVTEYAEAMERGDKFPPVSVIYDGDDYWLYDGFHRVRAAEKRGKFQIRAEVEQGTREDAVWESLASNKKHGLRRSQADKRRAIKRALKHTYGAEASNSKIAKHIGCSHATVRKYRKELESACQIDKVNQREGADGKTYDTSNIGSSARQSESDIAQGLEAGKEFYCKYCYKAHSQWQRGGPEYEHTDREIWECEFCDHASAAVHLSTETPDVDQSESEMQPEGGTKPGSIVPDTTPSSSAPSPSPPNGNGQHTSEPDLTTPKQGSIPPKTAEDVVDQICKHIAEIDVSSGATDTVRFIEELDKFTDQQRKRVAQNLRSTAQRLWNRADKVDPTTDS